MNVCLICYEEAVNPVSLCTTINHVACKVCTHSVILHATTTFSFPLRCCGRNPLVLDDKAACPALLADSTITSLLTTAELDAYHCASIEAALRQATVATQVFLRTSCCTRPFEIDRQDCPIVQRTVACMYGCQATMCTGCLQTLTLAELRLVETQQLEVSAPQPTTDTPSSGLRDADGVDDSISLTSASRTHSGATAMSTDVVPRGEIEQSERNMTSSSSSSSSSSTQPDVRGDVIGGGFIVYSPFISDRLDTRLDTMNAVRARVQAISPARNDVHDQGGNTSVHNRSRFTVTNVAADGSVDVTPVEDERKLDLPVTTPSPPPLSDEPIFADDLPAVVESGALYVPSTSLIVTDAQIPTEGYALRRLRQTVSNAFRQVQVPLPQPTLFGASPGFRPRPSLAELGAMLSAQQGSPSWLNRGFSITPADTINVTHDLITSVELAAITRVSLRDLSLRGQGMRHAGVDDAMVQGGESENTSDAESLFSDVENEEEQHISVLKVHDHMGPLCFRPELHESPQSWMHLTAGDSERKWTDECLLRLFRQTLDAWTPRCPRCRRVGLKSGSECNVIDCDCGIQWCFSCSKQLHHTVGDYLIARRMDTSHTALMMVLSSSSASSSSEALHDGNERHHRPVDVSDNPTVVLSNTNHHARFSSAAEAFRYNPAAPGEGDRLCPSTLEQLAITYAIPDFVAARDAYYRVPKPLMFRSLHSHTVQDGIEFRLMEPFLRLRGICALRTLQSKLPAHVFLRGLRTLPEWSRDTIVCTALAVELDPTAALPRTAVSAVAPDLPALRSWMNIPTPTLDRFVDLGQQPLVRIRRNFFEQSGEYRRHGVVRTHPPATSDWLDHL